MNASEIPNPIPNFPEFGHISLSGLHNARDLGGMPCEDDWVITPARLIRSDALHHATKEDFDTLTHDHELSRVIDLRSDLERNANPDPLATNIFARTAGKSLLDFLGAHHIAEKLDSDIDVLFYANRRFLDTAFASVDEAYGSFDAYLAEALDCDKDKQEHLRYSYRTKC